jgi:hypothetical protein
MPQIQATIPAGGTYISSEVYSKNKLDMVNRCLRSIGEVPLPDGTLLNAIQTGTDADVARRVVEETMREVQAIGWYFNTDYDFRLYKDDQDMISVPPTLLRMDTQYDNQYVIKEGKVYDVYNFTFIIEPKYIEADLVWLKDYEELPTEVFEYIALRSARKFQEVVITAAALTEITRAQEMDAYVQVQRMQMRVQAYNIQNAKVSTRTHNGYLRVGLYNTKTRR